MSVKGEANCDQPPKSGEPFCGCHAVGVRRVALDDLPVKVNGGAGTECVEFGGFRRQRSGEKCRHQQTDDTVRQLLQDKSDKHIIGVVRRGAGIYLPTTPSQLLRGFSRPA